jgi:hypothetical protein
MVTKLQLDRLALCVEELAERMKPADAWPRLYIWWGKSDEEFLARHPELRGPDGKCKPMRTINFE